MRRTCVVVHNNTQHNDIPFSVLTIFRYFRPESKNLEGCEYAVLYKTEAMNPLSLYRR